jgi:translocator protein
MEPTTTNPEPVVESRVFLWWHALVIFVIANLVSALPVGYGGDEIFYNSFEQPPFSPPSWLFAPMWLFLNVTSLIALSIVANSPERSMRRRTWVWLF